MEMPSTVNGKWALRDADGKVIASSTSHPTGAKLTLEPVFYKSRSPQTISEVSTRGSSGKKVRQILQVSALKGKLQALDIPDKPQPVVPVFDKPPEDMRREQRQTSTAGTAAATAPTD